MARSVIDEVEEEYGQPFWDVVRGYAEDGHSKYAISGILGYASYPSFIRLIKRHKIDIEFVKGSDSIFSKEEKESRRGKCTDALLAQIANLCGKNPKYLKIDYNGKIATLAQHARDCGIPERTVRGRYAKDSSDLERVFSLTKLSVPPPKNAGWQSKENRKRNYARA